jgi:PAS domain S-box-containing protein
MAESASTRIYRHYATIAAYISIVAGILVLAGWWLHITVLTSIRPGLISMKPNTAACFLLLGIALLLLRTPVTGSTSLELTRLWGSRVCATVAILTGAASLIERFAARDFGIDLLFVPHTLLATQGTQVALMAAASGVAFVLLGAALLLIDWETPRKHRPAQLLAILIIAIGFISILGYIYGVEPLSGSAGHTAMAVHTAVIFALLGLAVLFARPASGMVSVLTSDLLGGLMARRFFPILLVLPVVIGWLRLKGQLAGHYNTEFGLALFTASNVAISAVVLWTGALWLNRVDTDKRRAEERDEELAAIVASSSDAIVGKTLEGIITSWNRGAARLYGYTEAEALGRSISMLVPPDHLDDISLFLAQIRKGIPIERFETTRQRKDGSLLYVSLTISPVHGRDGSVVGASTVARDVTERKQAEERLNQSQGQLKGIIDSAMDAVITVNQEQNIVMFNGAAEKMFGYAASDVMRQPLERLIPKRLRSGHAEHIRTFSHTGTTSRAMGALGSLSGLRKDGTEFPLEASISQVETGGGRFFTAIVRDITERVNAERALREQARVMDLAQVLVRDMQDHIVLWNRGAENLYGFTRDEALGQISHELLQTKFPEPMEVVHDTLLKTGTWEGELLHRRKDGSRLAVASVWMLERHANGDPWRILEANTDVTERKRAEEAVRESEARMNEAQNNAHIGSWRYVPGESFTLSDEMYNLYKIPRGVPVTYEMLQSAVHPDDRANTTLPKAIESGALVFQCEVRLLWPDGQIRNVFALGKIHRDAAGKVIEAVGTVQDITERKQAEEAMQLAQARLVSALEGGRMGTWVWDISKGFIDWDNSMSLLFGRSPEELASGSIEPFFSWIHPQDNVRAREDIERVLQDGTTYDSEYRLFRPDKSVVWITSRGKLERDANGAPFRMTGICVDITDRKKMEEQLLQSQKMESLGTLAGGIAHDFNNILLAIGGNASLASADLPPDHPVQRSLQEISKASGRASSLVRQILAFSRRQSADRDRIAVQPVVEEALALLRATLPARIDIRSSFSPELPAILADSTQLHQIIMNLGTNSVRAMGEHLGLLEVNARVFNVTKEFAESTARLREGQYVRISVSDNGCGMDSATMERIFDPFFTTQAPGQGTGLGLSVVHGIMKDHDGAVTVYSEPGKGTIFNLYFPAAGATQEKKRDVAAMPNGHGERLLYVDDEDALVMLATRSLCKLGYEVTGFTDPVKALQTFKENPQHFAAVITDLSMPGMSGAELAREIIAIRRDVPVVITSGYIRPEDEANARVIGVRDMILKPDTIDELAKALQRVFNAATMGAASESQPHR